MIRKWTWSFGTLQSERVLIDWDIVSWKGAGNGI